MFLFIFAPEGLEEAQAFSEASLCSNSLFCGPNPQLVQLAIAPLILKWSCVNLHQQRIWPFGFKDHKLHNASAIKWFREEFAFCSGEDFGPPAIRMFSVSVEQDSCFSH